MFKYFSFSEDWFSPLPFSPLCGRRYFCKCSRGGSDFCSKNAVSLYAPLLFWGLAGVSCVSSQGSSPSQGRGERAGCLLQEVLLVHAGSRARPVCPCTNSPVLSTVAPSPALVQAAKVPGQGLSDLSPQHTPTELNYHPGGSAGSGASEGLLCP